jgi:hypothetical protein
MKSLEQRGEETGKKIRKKVSRLIRIIISQIMTRDVCAGDEPVTLNANPDLIFCFSLLIGSEAHGSASASPCTRVKDRTFEVVKSHFQLEVEWVMHLLLSNVRD